MAHTATVKEKLPVGVRVDLLAIKLKVTFVLFSVDNSLTGSPLPPNRLSPNLKQYTFLGSMTSGESKHFSLKYYFLNGHDWTNLYQTYHEIFTLWPSLADKDSSQVYQYGALVYGLARMYQVTVRASEKNRLLIISSGAAGGQSG